MYTIKSVAHNTFVMFLRKKSFKAILLLITVIICSFTFAPFTASADSSGFYLGGFPAGFVLSTTRVEVVGLCEVITEDGVFCPARDAGISAGDVISRINGEQVKKSRRYKYNYRSRI